MNIGRIDVFENESEITKMVGKLQKQGLEYMKEPDAFWHTKTHSKAMKETRRMGQKVLASL